MKIQYISHEERVTCKYCNKQLFSGSAHDYYIEQSTCEHVQYVHDSETIFYISDNTRNQLKQKGISEQDLSDSLYNGGEISYLRDIVEFPDGIEYEISAGGMTTLTLHICISK